MSHQLKSPADPCWLVWHKVATINTHVMNKLPKHMAYFSASSSLTFSPPFYQNQLYMFNHLYSQSLFFTIVHLQNLLNIIIIAITIIIINDNSTSDSIPSCDN